MSQLIHRLKKCIKKWILICDVNKIKQNITFGRQKCKCKRPHSTFLFLNVRQCLQQMFEMNYLFIDLALREIKGTDRPKPTTFDFKGYTDVNLIGRLCTDTPVLFLLQLLQDHVLHFSALPGFWRGVFLWALVVNTEELWSEQFGFEEKHVPGSRWEVGSSPSRRSSDAQLFTNSEDHSHIWTTDAVTEWVLSFCQSSSSA